MNENTGPKDQSMDEILGSIRRIINEDNAQSGGARVAPVDDTPSGDEDEEEVIDLTEEVSEDEQEGPRLESSFGEPQDRPAEAGPRREPVLGLHSPAQQPAPRPWDEPAAAESSEEEESEPVGETEEPSAISSIGAGPADDAAEEPADAVPETEPEFEQAVAEEPEPAMDMPPAVPQSAPQASVAEMSASRAAEIVSETTTAATATAIGDLTRAMEEKSSKLKVGADEATISDIVKEMLRPMLREWMDENLPGIVERIVRREIQKLVDRAEDDD